jgi:hypothetical protein
MNKITSTEFQSNYQRLDEPVVVMARSRTLGTWYPKGSEPEYAAPVEIFAPKTAVRASIRNGGFGHSTPAPKGN